MQLIVNYIVGWVLAIYFVCTVACGIFIQAISRKKSKEMFGEFPVTQIVFHVLISLSIVLFLFNVGGFLFMYLGIGLVLWVIKNIVNLCNLREHKAFNNLRSASDTDTFLNNIRTKVPIVQFYCECSHQQYRKKKDLNGNTTTVSQTIISYTETRYAQITGMIDQTPALYVVANSPLIYLKLKEQINWLGNSQMIINHISAVMYQQNQNRDNTCTVTFSVNIPGLTSQNYLKRGEYPSWINQGLLWASSLLQFDVLYICILRSRIPKTQLPVVKSCSIDPTFQINQPSQRLTIDQIQLQSFEQMCPAEINSIQLPPILEENTQPLLTDIKPPYLDSLNTITVNYHSHELQHLIAAEYKVERVI
ncbi:Transmembrane_domain-containing protein [Hexamita inflata]|uniref:Transmembrane domain-containing protein n=1 Tax=Hexamita inflata TaxID=28002 RepID=A0AA86NHH6_9EUKA|nr:Transmembrane domain-containing protein [Hexamita inflata]